MRLHRGRNLLYFRTGRISTDAAQPVGTVAVLWTQQVLRLTERMAAPA